MHHGIFSRRGPHDARFRAPKEEGRQENQGLPRVRYPWIEPITGMSRIATMFAILIIGLIAGPAVSL
ncbi:hypothetical protein BH20ACT14_BH20ACT14_02650 [soil metagenome]